MVFEGNKTITTLLVVLFLVFIAGIMIFAPEAPTGAQTASPAFSFKINSVEPFLDSAQVNWTVYRGSELGRYEIQYREKNSFVWNRAAIVNKNAVKVIKSLSCNANGCTIALNQYTSDKGSTRAYVISGIPDLAHKTYSYRVVSVSSVGRVLASTPAVSSTKTTYSTMGAPCNDECPVKISIF